MWVVNKRVTYQTLNQWWYNDGYLIKGHTNEERMHRRGEEVHTKEEEVMLSQMPKQKECVLYQTTQKSGKKKEKRYVKKERKKFIWP